MRASNYPYGRARTGQTLVIALIVLGVLLVVGLVFLGAVARATRSSARAAQHTVAGDLAEAGVRYAHQQLLTSAKGADWRGELTPPSSTKDPDYEYLRPAPSPSSPDRGGPDRLGAYTRVLFANGRALVRVSYAPSTVNTFSENAAGPFKQAARMRDFLLIQAVGRPGVVNPNDPTTQTLAGRQEQAARMALVSIGTLESARFETNKYRVSKPVELGVPSNLGAEYQGVSVTFPIQVGALANNVYNLNGVNTPSTYAPPTLSAVPVATGGGMQINSDLLVYGALDVAAAPALGDAVAVSGTVTAADDTSSLTVTRSDVDATGAFVAATTQSLVGPNLNSRSGSFSTLGDVLRDGLSRTDAQGYPNGIQYKAPPSISTVDPSTGVSRYVQMTRESGKINTSGVNSGHFGHGGDVYVDNSDDRQEPADESGRIGVGPSQSLVYDLLNPNNGDSNSAWQGPFYVPRGAYVTLTSNGFYIARDSRSVNRTWKDAQGVDSGNSVIQFRLGMVGTQLYIVDSLTPGVNIGAIASSDVHFNLGMPFDGVLYFEGDARVRGVIPTNVQLTIVSDASIFIEGSITKGVVENNVTTPTPTLGRAITGNSSSLLALMAKDYVVVNTTQFVGPGPNAAPPAVDNVPAAAAYNPARLAAAGASLSMVTELVLDPESSPSYNLQTPYAMEYADGGAPLPVQLLLTHAMDDGPAPNSFVQMHVNYGLDNPSTGFTPDSPYLFALDANNSASLYPPYAPTPSTYITPNYDAGTVGRGPILGLGVQAWQRWPKTETDAFPLFDSDGTTTFSFPSLTPRTGPDRPTGTYMAQVQDEQSLAINTTNVGTDPTNDYLIARAAVVPNDVRIEAMIYAEEGSFFVIPGPWFEPNPNDTRTAYTDDATRLQDYGMAPYAPFYGEPLDVRVTVVGSISENMPPPIGQQAEWLRKWGWIPLQLGASGHNIPSIHIPAGWDTGAQPYVPNLKLIYDPEFATGRVNGYLPDDTANPPIRVDSLGRVLPPLPRLPVSPDLAYFGEESS